jgi:hypothetical protein
VMIMGCLWYFNQQAKVQSYSVVQVEWRGRQTSPWDLPKHWFWCLWRYWQFQLGLEWLQLGDTQRSPRKDGGA